MTSRAAAAATVPVTIEVGAPLGGRRKSVADKPFEEAEARMQGRMEELGVPGRPAIELRRVASQRAVRIRVHGAIHPFSPAVYADVWHSVTGDPPDAPMPDFVLPPGAQQEVRDWLGDRSELVVAFLSELAYHAVLERPGPLVSRAQAQAYVGGRARPKTGGLPVDDVLFVMRSLLDLGVGLRDRELVLQSMIEGLAAGRSVEDTFEALFSELRSDSVSLVMNPVDLPWLTPGGRDPRVSVYGEEVPDDLRGEFAQIEEQLYVALGVRIPHPMLEASPEVPKGMVAVRVNDHTSLPRPDIVSPAWTAYELLFRHADRLLGIEDVEYALAQLGDVFPELVSVALPSLSLGELTRVLRGLVREYLPVRNLVALLERLLQYDTIPIDAFEHVVLDDRLPVADGGKERSAADLMAFVRGGTGLRSYLTNRYSTDGRVQGIALGLETERRALEAVATGSAGGEAGEEIRDAVWARIEDIPLAAGVVLAVTPAARAALREILAPEFPDLAVLAPFDLLPEARIDRLEPEPSAKRERLPNPLPPRHTD